MIGKRRGAVFLPYGGVAVATCVVVLCVGCREGGTCPTGQPPVSENEWLPQCGRFLVTDVVVVSSGTEFDLDGVWLPDSEAAPRTVATFRVDLVQRRMRMLRREIVVLPELRGVLAEPMSGGVLGGACPSDLLAICPGYDATFPIGTKPFTSNYEDNAWAKNLDATRRGAGIRKLPTIDGVEHIAFIVYDILPECYGPGQEVAVAVVECDGTCCYAFQYGLPGQDQCAPWSTEGVRMWPGDWIGSGASQSTQDSIAAACGRSTDDQSCTWVHWYASLATFCPCVVPYCEPAMDGDKSCKQCLQWRAWAERDS